MTATSNQAFQSQISRILSCQPAPAQEPAPLVPPYMVDLVTRAADQLAAHWPAHVVEFPRWEAGKEYRYTARLEWNQGMQGPRVQVFDARTGQFICQSLEGWITKIDPAVWSIDVPDDEVAMHDWQERERVHAELLHGFDA
jgi:hypothetical protein